MFETREGVYILIGEVVALYFGVRFINCYYGFVFIIILTIGSCISIKLSFTWNLCLHYVRGILQMHLVI
jgi:hypothetical protein